MSFVQRCTLEKSENGDYGTYNEAFHALKNKPPQHANTKSSSTHATHLPLRPVQPSPVLGALQPQARVIVPKKEVLTDRAATAVLQHRRTTVTDPAASHVCAQCQHTRQVEVEATLLLHWS